MDAYITVLLGLVCANIVIAILKRKDFFQASYPRSYSAHELSEFEHSLHDSFERVQTFDAVIRGIQGRYFPVYILVFAADWLQGPYVYAVYKSQHGLSDREIALLFITGFACGALSSTCAGQLIDRLGRKKACITYCILFTLSSLSVLFHAVPMLFLGRALGGISTTLLFSAFEAWLIADFSTSGIENEAAQGSLKHIFGTTAVLNSVVAILAGIISQMLVTNMQSETAPFIASVACLAGALFLITTTWSENYGTSVWSDGNHHQQNPSGSCDPMQNAAANLPDKIKILVLGFFVCVFEGTMYVFVHFWPQAIITARRSEAATVSTPVFGIIFASMMSAMCLGSFIFKALYSTQISMSGSIEAIEMAAVFGTIGLIAVTLTSREHSRFGGFLLYEGCVGLYFPAMASLKANVVGNHHRGRVYATMRLALNMFVLITLGTVGEGEEARKNRLMLCSGLLVLAIVAVRWRF